MLLNTPRPGTTPTKPGQQPPPNATAAPSLPMAPLRDAAPAAALQLPAGALNPKPSQQGQQQQQGHGNGSMRHEGLPQGLHVRTKLAHAVGADH